ncbi:hypothetical protein B0J15DRAFT_468311 [Fusarium solani]|uniref:Uncharacterized protein n=1 Tax=Fusarium solani TaxID=169388 RepID=A0A9P9H071_FUSSL|nr:uncharacterized protein B0J15DRAFT_468311 [Fusarium solani]KAH7248301.1 hypothetical protein B0J15DRAFT_468311 [Fusarium solani]
MSVDSINICNNIDLCDAFQQNPGFVSLLLQEKNDMIQIIQKARSTIAETFDKTPHNLKVTATACYADEENIHKTHDEILSTEQLFYKYASFRGLGVLSALATRSRAYQERLSRLPKSSQRVVCEDLKEHALSESLAGFIDKVRSKVIRKKKSKTAARSSVVSEHPTPGSHPPEPTHTAMASTEQERATHEMGSTSSKRSASAHDLEHEESCLKKQKHSPSEEAVLPPPRNANGRNEEREWMPPAAVPNPILSIRSEPESNGASLWHDHVPVADRHKKLIGKMGRPPVFVSS